MARRTLLLLAATHAFQPRAPVQRLRPLRVEVFDEATLLVEQAVEWSRDEHPLAEPCVCETAEPIVTSTIFWSVVNDACQFPAKEATVIFDKDDFPVDEWSDMVSSLGIEGLTCEVEDEAPLPCVKISVDWSPEDAGFVSDEMADASVESLKTWVQDVIVDSKVCPFTRSAEVAATGLENQGVEKGPIMYPVCGAVGSGGAALVRVLRAFWGSSIDMLSQPPSEASTVLLSVPAYAERDHDAFVDMTQVVVKTLKHIGAEHQLSLVFFHPDYERSVIEPVDSFTHGHLPPHKWLRAYVRLTEGEEVATGLSEAQLKHADYQRRAPFTMINILRSEQVEAAEAVVPWEVIEPEPDRRVRVSGARVYAKNIWRFATDASERTVDGYKYLVTGGKAGKGPAVGGRNIHKLSAGPAAPHSLLLLVERLRVGDAPHVIRREGTVGRVGREERLELRFILLRVEGPVLAVAADAEEALRAVADTQVAQWQDIRFLQIKNEVHVAAPRPDALDGAEPFS